MTTKNYMRFLNGILMRDGNGYEVILYRLQNIDGTRKVIEGKMGMNQGTFTPTYTSGLFHDTNLRSTSMDSNTTGTGMFLGKGTTPPTSDDYKLEDIIEYSDTGMSVISTALSSAPDDDTLLSYTFTVKNNGSDPVTIGEIGMISNTNLYNNRVIFLWARDTIEPVVMQPGEIRAFNLTVRLG